MQPDGRRRCRNCMKAADALVIPAVGPKLAPRFVRGQHVSSSSRSPVPASTGSTGRADAARHSGRQRSRRQQRAVAEYAVTTASMLLRRLAWADAEIKAGPLRRFPRPHGGRQSCRHRGPAGRRGRVRHHRPRGGAGFQRMGCRIAFYDPAPRDLAPAQALGAQSMSLDELLAAADVVSLHVPLLPATHGPDRRRRARAHEAGRGADPGLARRHRRRSGAGRGISRPAISAAPPSTSIRPSRPRPTIRCSRSRARRARRLLLTPHIAGVTRQASALLFRSAWQNVERVLARGEPPLHRVY